MIWYLSIPINIILTVASDVPDGWNCLFLDTIQEDSKSCSVGATFNGNNIFITNEQNEERPANSICPLLLEPRNGVEKLNSYYYHFTITGDVNMAQVFIMFNMADTKNGNYILLRIGMPILGNIEAGILEKGVRHPLYRSPHFHSHVRNLPVSVRILIDNDEQKFWFNGVFNEHISMIDNWFYARSNVGVAMYKSAVKRSVTIQNPQICSPILCRTPDGNIVQGGTKYMDEDGIKECECKMDGVSCNCPEAPPCNTGTTLWTDAETCQHSCITAPKVCYSSGDPHYGTFDGKRYDFHGECTYQAASCDDFVVYFKNLDRHNRPPRYTLRIELHYRGDKFIIGNNWLATVNDKAVILPYGKSWTDGTVVKIFNNGQLEIELHSKGRSPTVKLRAHNGGWYINAYVYLHGSCAGQTEGLCGNFNGRQDDDLHGGTPNSAGIHYQLFDEHCKPPPGPFDPCEKLDKDTRDKVYQSCSRLLTHPFNRCKDAVDVGTVEVGLLKDCITDVCNCEADEVCACTQYEDYATLCEKSGIDLSDWTDHVTFCPMNCPEGMVYQPNGPSPHPTCDDENLSEERARGCFCPDIQNTRLHKGKCIHKDACKALVECIHEGQAFKINEEIENEGTCEMCVCGEGGKWSCKKKTCPELQCEETELEGHSNDKCCPFCIRDWVIAVNPKVTVNRKQDVTLTCDVKADVKLRDIAWYKGSTELKIGTSIDRKRLTLLSVDKDDAGTYTCKATKDTVTASADFQVNVVMPDSCTKDNHVWYVDEFFNPKETQRCLCQAQDKFVCECLEDEMECSGNTPIEWFPEECVKKCVPKPGLCQASTDPHYKSFDGKQFDFKGGCTYQIFSCGDVKVTADHDKNSASTVTKSITVYYKTDAYKMEADEIFLNGQRVDAPFEKPYNDESVVKVDDVGEYRLDVSKAQINSFVKVNWDKKSTYSIEVHGSCHGRTRGICGNWNGNKQDDFLTKDGILVKFPEKFGVQWKVDDFEDCPFGDYGEVCQNIGIPKEKSELLKMTVKNILIGGPLKKCYEALGDEVLLQNALDDICYWDGDLNGACIVLGKFAERCKTEGVDPDIIGWELKESALSCIPDCEKLLAPGAQYNPKGPDPAPSCINPNGGNGKQTGCFCPQGTVISERGCIKKEECRCNHAGTWHDVGEVYTVEDKCETCECRGGGLKPQCTKMECTETCGQDKVGVRIDGKCCPVCFGTWMEAVNPMARGKLGNELTLTCSITNKDVIVKEVKWIKYNPGYTDITDQAVANGLGQFVLKIAKLTEDSLGFYKCVGVDETGEKAEGTFTVGLLLHENMIEQAVSDISYFPGSIVSLKVTKTEVPIVAIYWICNGERITTRTPGYSVYNKKKYNEIRISGKMTKKFGANKQTVCFCVATGVGSRDDAKFILTPDGKDSRSKISIVPVTDDDDDIVTCKENKKGCKLQFKVTATGGNQKIEYGDVQICKLIAGKPDNCRKAKNKGQIWSYIFKPHKNSVGEYRMLISSGLEVFTSSTVTLNLEN